MARDDGSSITGGFSYGSGSARSKSSSGSRGGSSTSRANKAASARLNAQGRAYKASGQLSRNGRTWYGPPNAAADLEAWLAARDMVDGGGGGGGYGGGGGGGGGYDPALLAQKAGAESRVAGQRGQLDKLYSDYHNLIKDNPELTKRTYATLRDESAKGGAAIAAQADTRQDQADAGRAAAFSTLGVSPEAVAASPSESQTATQEGLMNLAKESQSWGNLQGVLGAAQESRDRLDIQGVGDAKVLAHRQLTQNYEDFMRQLDAQLAASYSSGGGGGGYSGGGGSGGGGVTNKYRGMMDDAIFKDLLKANGIGVSSDSGSSSKSTTTTQKKYSSTGAYLGKTVTSKK